jgi:hypothetical protein
VSWADRRRESLGFFLLQSPHDVFSPEGSEAQVREKRRERKKRRRRKEEKRDTNPL